MIDLNEVPSPAELDEVSSPAAVHHDRFVLWPAAFEVIRGREREILELAGVSYRVNGSDHIHCPFRGHTDNHPSFRLLPPDENGNCKVICSQNCPVASKGASIFDAWAALKGVTLDQAKIDIMEALGRHDLIIDRAANLGLKLSEYAKEKQLPEDFLRNVFVLTDGIYFSKTAIFIPYFGASRQFIRNRIRKALKKIKGKKDDRFVWDDKKGVPLCLYGIWRVYEFKDYILLVEGESDTHTGWYYDEPVLGLPGAGNFNEKRDAPLLSRFASIYVLKEPDAAGDKLVEKLRQSSLAPRIRVVTLPDGIKDLSALHLHLLAQGRAAEFRSILWQAMQDAKPLSDLPLPLIDDTKPRSELAQLYADFNKKYAVVKDGGKTRVFERVLDPMLGRLVMIAIGFGDFRNLYMNWKITVTFGGGQEITKTAAEWWLGYKDRTQFTDGFVLDPTGKQHENRWNLWTGFSETPAQGDWSLLRNHIWNVVCQNNESLFNYVMNWFARMFQHPDETGEVALVFRGKKGAGKGKALFWIMKALGQHAKQIFNAEHLVGRFNNHLRDLVFLFADEAFYAGDRKHEGVLKGLITEMWLPIEGKGLDLVMVRNMLHVAMASNQDWVVPASADERRFCAIDVSDAKIGDFPYFAAIDEQMNNGGLAAMIHEFLNRDISQFEVRSVPQTDALTEQKAYSLNSLARWWLTVLERGFVYKSRHGAPAFEQWYNFVSTELLWNSYLQWCDETRVNYRQTRVELGKMMAELYQFGRPWEKTIIGEVEVLHPSRDGISAGKGWVNQEAVQYGDHKPGYSVDTLDAARARFAAVKKVSGRWEG